MSDYLTESASSEATTYLDKVSAYLAKHRLRRLPWGALVSEGHVTMTRTFTERRERAELGEVAIALLSALGVTLPTLNEIAALPWTASEEEMLAKLQEILSHAADPSNG